MTLNFEPHSWYKGAAIKYENTFPRVIAWRAYIEDGMRAYSIIEIHASTLKELKQKITNFNAR